MDWRCELPFASRVVLRTLWGRYTARTVQCCSPTTDLQPLHAETSTCNYTLPGHKQQRISCQCICLRKLLHAEGFIKECTSSYVRGLKNRNLHNVQIWSRPTVVSCNWMSAASVAVVVTSGERHAWALCVYLGAKRRYINTLPFLSFYWFIISWRWQLNQSEVTM